MNHVAVTQPALIAPTRVLGENWARKLAINVASLVLASLIMWVYVLLAGGARVWMGTPENALHLACCYAAAALVLYLPGRAKGSLEVKLGQTFVAVALVFGGYALLILAGRLYFSRTLLITAAWSAWLLSFARILVRHYALPHQVAVLAPLIDGAGQIPQGSTLVSSPDVDLRQFDTLLIASPEAVTPEWSRAIGRAMLTGSKVRHISEYVEERRGAVVVNHFHVDHVKPRGLLAYATFKRLADIGLVIFIAPLALPIFLLGAAAVLLTTGRPLFFVQERVGLGAESFRMWKLRSMRPEMSGEGPRAAVKGDDRVTPIGRLIRRFRVDELPQLWNVLRGDMSLVGPRPEAKALHEAYVEVHPEYQFRTLVRPGITGWAQVSVPPSQDAGGARQKLSYDLFYVKQMSLFLDAKIVARTFWTIASGGGVR